MFFRLRSFDRAVRRAAGVALVLCAGAAHASAAGDEPPSTTILRVFLKDGSSISSYGEYARVGDRVVFSMPLTAGADADQLPELHLVNLPDSAVDWTATEKYADAARYAHYVATRGDLDYAAINNHVAQVLAEMSASTSPARRLELALAARKALAEWPAAHYGYRSADIAQISGVLDEVIADLRAQTGGTAFDLSLVANIRPPDPVSLLPPPSDREAVEQALAVAKVTDVVGERMSLLESIATVLARSSGAGDADPWRSATLTAVSGELAEERRLESAYALVSTELRRSAERYARNADVAGVERVIASVDRRDRWLGRKRPDHVNALVHDLEAELENAQRLRLARDRWALRLPFVRRYATAAFDLLTTFDAVRPKLDDIRRLAGPSDATLARVTHTVDGLADSLRALSPPEETAMAHALVLSALDLAASAARTRREAIRSGDLETARNASAAAAGAMMLMTRARDEIGAQLEPPRLDGVPRSRR